MKQYRVVLTRTAEKELYKLPKSDTEKIIVLLKSLEQNPRPPAGYYFFINAFACFSGQGENTL